MRVHLYMRRLFYAFLVCQGGFWIGGQGRSWTAVASVAIGVVGLLSSEEETP